MTDTRITLQPIGLLRTPWKTPSDCPRNGRQPDPIPTCHVELFPPFHGGLRDIDGFSHLILLYWLGQAKAPPAELLVVPAFDDRPRGVFSIRTPQRPNPIGLSVVAFDGRDGPGRLRVRYLDCVDGTPLLDIKPYLRTTDAEPQASMGWLGLRPPRNP